MSDENAAVETEVENDAPIIDPSRASEETPETQVEQPIAVHEESEPDPLTTTDQEVDDDPIERPEYYPEKFWDDDGPDVEKLAKSYAELEKKFKSGKHKAPEGDYDTSTFTELGIEADDPMLNSFSEWAKDNGISQSAFEGMVQQYMDFSGAETERMEYDRNAEIQKLGENAQQKIEMADRLLMKAPLSDAEREALESHINDPRWQTDPAWRRRIEKLWMESQV